MAVQMSAKSVFDLDFSDRLIYETWLAQAYYFVRHSTPMLALSCGLAIENREYNLRCISHLAEEKGHDRMLLNDLKKIGSSIENVPEFSSTRALYQTQYYWIEHVNPVSFLGYIMVLEGIAVHCGPRKVEETKSFAGSSFVKLHAQEDLDHFQSALSQLDLMSEKDQRDIVGNAEHTADLYRLMASEISDRARRLSAKVA